MELITYIRILIKNWYLFLLGLVVTVAATMIFTLNQPKIYQAKASFVIRPSTALIVEDEFVSTLDTLSRRTEINNTFAEVADSRLVKQLAADQMGLSDSQRSGLSVNGRVLVGTNVLEITVKGKEPDLVRDFAGAVSAQLIAYVSSLYDVFELGQLDEAETPRQPVSPRPKLNMMLGVALGSMLGLALVFLAEYLRSPGNQQNRFDIMDPDSGIYNRAYFELRLGQEMSRARHNNSSLSVAFIRITSHHMEDGPNTKMIEGLMPRIATLFSLSLRDEDILARFDRTIFALMIPEVTGEEAQSTVEEMRIKLGLMPLQGDGSSSPMKIFVAAGIVVRSERDDDEHALLLRVDRALAETGHSTYGKVVLMDGSEHTTSLQPARPRAAEQIAEPEETKLTHEDSPVVIKDAPQQNEPLLDSNGGHPATVQANNGKPPVEHNEELESRQEEVPTTGDMSPSSFMWMWPFVLREEEVTVANSISPAKQGADPEIQPKLEEQESEKSITPAALKLANEYNLVLHDIEGSGQHGRILKSDVEELISADQRD